MSNISKSKLKVLIKNLDRSFELIEALERQRLQFVKENILEDEMHLLKILLEEDKKSAIEDLAIAYKDFPDNEELNNIIHKYSHIIHDPTKHY